MFFDLQADLSHAIEILDMHAIFETIAGELHANKIGNRRHEDTFAGRIWRFPYEFR